MALKALIAVQNAVIPEESRWRKSDGITNSNNYMGSCSWSDNLGCCQAYWQWSFHGVKFHFSLMKSLYDSYMKCPACGKYMHKTKSTEKFECKQCGWKE